MSIKQGWMLAAIAASAVLSHGAVASEVRFWQDPVVTFTNGMRLPSSTSQRSHNVYWQCDPGRRGYCDGRIYGPCRNELHSAGSRVHHGYRLPYSPTPGPVAGWGAGHSHDGFEAAQGERLGAIPLDEGNAPRLGLAPTASGGVADAAPSASQPPTGGIWLDTLQTLGEKVMKNAQAAEAF